jgi:hypothetical protein
MYREPSDLPAFSWARRTRLGHGQWEQKLHTITTNYWKAAVNGKEDRLIFVGNNFVVTSPATMLVKQA